MNSGKPSGYLAGSQGNATVAGSGSTWNHSVGLAVGYYGKGNLLVQQGGQVSTIAGYIGYYAGSEGTATLTGSGSKWTNTGTLFFVGRAGTGTLAIQQGAHLEHSGKAYLGFYSGSTGKVTVAGAGSLWNNTDAIYVGHVASGRVEIRDGGQVASSSAILGYASTGQGALVVSGSGSAWTVGGSGYVLAGYDGVGIIKIRSGGQISSPTGFLGYGSRSQATALVAGANSKWLNSSTLYVGKSGVASLDLRTGGQVTAQTVSINSRSTLSVDVGHGSLLTVGGGSGTLTNNGTVRIIAGAAAPAGSQYSPIAAGAWTGSGQYQAVGGTWNPSTRQFTASAVQSGASGSPIQMDLAQVQRLLVSDSATGWQVGASFLASSGPKSLTVTATAISGSVRTALESQLAAGESLLGGWLFTTTGSFALSDPAYLSFRVGSGWTEERLQVWQYQQASGWTRMEPGDLNYVNLYTNFLTTLGTLNGYGYAVSGLSAAGLAAMEAPPGEGKAEQPLSDPQSPSEPSPKPGSLERAPDLARELHLTDPLSILPEFSGLAQEVIEAVEEPSDLLVNIPAHYRNFHLMESPRPSDALQGAPEPSSLLLLLLASMGIGTYMLLRGRK